MNYAEIQKQAAAAVEKMVEIYKAGGKSVDDVRKDITSSSGAAAYDLEPVGVLLQPVITPLLNAIPRVANERGGTSSEWRYINSIVSKNFQIGTAEGSKSNKINYTWTAVTKAFAEIGVRDTVTWAAKDAAKTFEPDIKARAVMHTLFALKIMQEQLTVFGRTTNLGATTTPTAVTSTTGGTIAAPSSSYNAKVRAITGMGDGTNTRGRISALVNFTTTGATSSVVLYTTPSSGAIGYEWYVDDGNGGAYTLQTTTGWSSVKLTALTTNGVNPPADNVADTTVYDGLVAQIVAQTPAAQVKVFAADQVNGLGNDFALSDIDAMNKAAWDNAKADPDAIYLGSSACARLTNLWLAANGGPVSYVVPDSSALGNLTGGYRLVGYVNKITGKTQKIVTHPNIGDGLMFALSFSIPFPTGGDQVGVDVEYSRGYQQIDYPPTGRFDEFEVYNREVVRLKFPGGAWAMLNFSGKTTT